MKHIKKYKEIKYNSEHIKLITKVRYRLNKYFGANCCGVSKNRGSFNGNFKWIPSEVLLFKITLPSIISGKNINNYDEKIKNFNEFSKKIGLTVLYNYNNDDHATDFIATEEQMKEIIFGTKYINLISDIQKYNL